MGQLHIYLVAVASGDRQSGKQVMEYHTPRCL